MTKDLTQGSPTRLILQFSFPLMLGFLLQQFYNFVDTAIVGKTLGLDALAAVGSTSSLNFLILGFCMGVCSGFSIPAAQAFGARDIPRMRRFVVNAALLSAAFALVITALTVTLCPAMLGATRTPDNIRQDAYAYIVVIFAFIPVTIFYNFLSSVIRALGDSRTPVIFLIMAALLNIALDFWFILGLKLGVTGAALATGLSQLAAGLGCLFMGVRHMDALTFHKKDWRWQWPYVKRLFIQGVPMGLQFSITAVGSVILAASVNTLGSGAVAAVTAGSKISMFFCCVFDALASTITTYAGQNVGAGRVDRIRQGVASCAVLGGIYCLVALAVVYFAGHGLIGLFVEESQAQAADDAYRFLLANALFYLPLLFVNVLRLMIQGVGYTGLAVMAGVFEMAARTLMGLVVVPALGFGAACFASPLAWVFADAFLFPASVSVLRKLEQKNLSRGVDRGGILVAKE